LRIIFNGIYYISYFCCCKCQVSILGMKTRKLHQPILKRKTDAAWLCGKLCDHQLHLLGQSLSAEMRMSLKTPSLFIPRFDSFRLGHLHRPYKLPHPSILGWCGQHECHQWETETSVPLSLPKWGKTFLNSFQDLNNIQNTINFFINAIINALCTKVNEQLLKARGLNSSIQLWSSNLFVPSLILLVTGQRYETTKFSK
jgi:hypothetical protein